MGRIVSLLGNKGGTGKTTLAHMLGQGLGLLGVRAVVALTDPTREPLSREGRRYLPSDARRPEDLKRVALTLRSVPGWVGIVDGGAGRVEFDQALARVSDLVLLPFRESHEDMRVVLQDLARIPQAWALPSQWPTNTWAREAAGRALDAQLAPVRDRVLEPVNALGATKVLLQSSLPASLPRPLEDACRQLARTVAEIAGIPLPEAPEARVSRQQVAGATHAVASR